jgi:hypothetical protein
LVAIPIAGTVTLIISSYDPHPLTSRGRLLFIDEHTELQLSNEAYPEILKEFSSKCLQPSDPRFQRVKQVAGDIIGVLGEEEGDRGWFLHVIEDDETINAMVTPNGKVFVFT